MLISHCLREILRGACPERSEWDQDDNLLLVVTPRGAQPEALRPRAPRVCSCWRFRSIAGPASEGNRDTQRSHEIVLEVVSATEVAVIQVILDVEPEAHPAIVTSAEAETEPQGTSEVGAAAIVVEGVLAPGEERATAADI